MVMELKGAQLLKNDGGQDISRELAQPSALSFTTLLVFNKQLEPHNAITFHPSKRTIKHH